MSVLTEYRLRNRHGDRVELLNFGARVTAIVLQTPNGPRNVTLGYAQPQDYLDDPFYMGCTVGRFCNRIGGSRFTLKGNTYRLAANQGPHHLHGGQQGFDKKFWHAGDNSSDKSVEFTLVSADDDQGYPGEVKVVTGYRWNDERELSINYTARCDKPTVLNLTNHCYFNLDPVHDDIGEHRIKLNAHSITEIDDDFIANGNLMTLEQSALDLRTPKYFDDVIQADHKATRSAKGIDFNYVLDGSDIAARVQSSDGNLTMTVATSYPGLQCYTGQHLATPFKAYGGFCLEPQYFPNSPNLSHFPTTVLQPGEVYNETIRYRFQETR